MIYNANFIISVYMLGYTCIHLSMIIHACVLVSEFASANDRAWILFCHFGNDLMANKSTGEEWEIVLSIAFASIMKYSVGCTDTEMILSPDSFESVRHMLMES